MRNNNWTLRAFILITLICLGVSTVENISAASKPSTADVKIDNFTFEPATLTVKVGTLIVWTNGDDIPHTVVGEDAAFKSKVLDTDDKFTFTATKPGTYTYFCSIHPKMTGKIVVQ